MGTSKKDARKIETALCMVVSFFLTATISANEPPITEDINSLSEAARLTTDMFMQESFKLRLAYEFGGRFLTQEDKENLHKLAKTTSQQLRVIAKAQTALKQQIEDYQGRDWDSRYGSTGLWRKLFGDLYITSISKCEIDFYLALSAQQPQKNKILRKILAQLDSLDQTQNAAYAQFLKARTLALLCRTDPAYRPSAEEQFDLLAGRSDIEQPTVFRIAIERIKLLGPAGADELDKLAEAIAKSSCTEDIELVLSLAFLQRRYDRDAFERTVQRWPRIEDFLGSSILFELSYYIERGQLDLQKISVLEAELASQAAWKNKTTNYGILLDQLSNAEKFQTPLILYVTAVAFADSSPAKALNLLVKASTLQQTQKSDRLDIEASKIAKQAARLAYNLFAQNQQHCRLTLEAFENYCIMAVGKIDEELQYLYSVVLNICGRTEKSKKLLQKIADRPTGNWRNRARLDLIINAIREKQNEKKEQRTELLKQLNDLIADCTGQNETDSRLWTKAVTIYCQLLLESEDGDSAQKVLNILTEAEAIRDPNLNVFKSQALWRLGRLDESADCLVRAAQSGGCEHVAEAMKLLSEIVDEIDRFQKDESSLMDNCKELAQFCYDCLDGKIKQRATLFLIEISVFAETKKRNKLSGFERLLDNMARAGLSEDVDFIRCRARLLARQGKFNKAAGLWAHIGQMRKSQSLSASRRSWKWWRAKYYELCCRAKWPTTEKNSLLHTIEVLENSFTDVPALWAKNISLLKQQTSERLIGAGN